MRLFFLLALFSLLCVGNLLHAQLQVNPDGTFFNEDETTIIDVLNNDIYTGSDTVRVTQILELPENGIAAVISDSTIEYSPFDDYNGNDTLLYEACDNNVCDSAIVVFTINPINDYPESYDDFGTTFIDSFLIVNVTNNDFDIDGDYLTVQIASQPLFGTATVIDDTMVMYEPAPGFDGEDTLLYRLCDDGSPSSLCDSALVFITVLTLNEMPEAKNDTVATFIETPIEIDVLANDTDPEGHNLVELNIITGPENGDIDVNTDLSLTYEPHLGYFGKDSIQYQVCDDGLPNFCDFAWVHIDVNELRIPDSFSPNGDGVNDTWEIVGIDKFPENQVRIINRWGETVFETTDYQNNWKGTSTDTSLSADGKVPNGTYFYIFQLTTDLEPLTGHLVIRK